MRLFIPFDSCAERLWPSTLEAIQRVWLLNTMMIPIRIDTFGTHGKLKDAVIDLGSFIILFSLVKVSGQLHHGGWLLGDNNTDSGPGPSSRLTFTLRLLLIVLPFF